MTTRRITREQFSDGLAIDGSRIQKAMEDIESYTNAVPVESIKSRFSMNHIVLTCQGAETPNGSSALTVANRTRVSPFFPADQTPSAVGGHRVKGLARLQSSAAQTAAGVAITTPMVWTASTIFARPVVLDTLSIFIEGSKVSAAETNGSVTSFTMFNAANNQSYHRVVLMVDTDNAYSAEDRRLNSKEFVLREFDEVQKSDAVQTPGSGVQDFAPGDIAAAGSRGPNRLYLEKQNIDLPIHQFARTRFRLVIYSPAIASNTEAINAEMRPLQATFYVGYKEALRG
jgi:hypothetical protein